MEGKFNSYLLTERQFLMGLSGRMGMQIGIKRCIYFVCKLKCDKSSSLGGSVEVSSLNANKGLSKSAEIHFVQLAQCTRRMKSPSVISVIVAGTCSSVTAKLIIYSEWCP